MKNSKKYYIIIWAILFALFNLVTFLIPHKYDIGFWALYAFSVLALIVELACGITVFGKNKASDIFLGLPLLKISYTSVICTAAVSIIFTAIPVLPDIIGVIICFVNLAITAIAVTQATAAAEIVSGIDKDIKKETQFIKRLTADAENLMKLAKSDEAKTACKKVYEAVRYSDPVSHEALSAIEAKITVKADELSTAVSNNDIEKIEEYADEIVLLIAERGNKCKVLK